VDGVDDALGSIAESSALSPVKLCFVGDVLKPALAVREDPLPARRLWRLLLLLPAVLPIELRFLRSFEFVRCRSCSLRSKLWLL
jgi:hypothetical protein